MPKYSQFNQMMIEKKYSAAAELLKSQIEAAVYVDPMDDYSWGVESDILAYRILADKGIREFIAFHEDLLSFFIKLERDWGHLHKGHLYFRIALGKLAENPDEALCFFEKSLEEDTIVAEKLADEGLAESAESMARRFPSYVTLAILEQVRSWPFTTKVAKESFFTGLAPLRFDVIWDRKEVDPYLVRQSLCRLLPTAAIDDILVSYRELCDVMSQNRNYALRACLVHFCGLVISRLILDNSAAIGLEICLPIAVGLGIIPKGSVQSTIELIYILDAQTGRPQAETSSHPFDPKVEQLAWMGMKILFDRALVTWSKV